MTRQNANRTISVRDPVPVVRELMQALVISVLDEHIDEAGLGVKCGSTWPCERASWSLPTIRP
ncbi:MAG: hypothetical protein ACREX3_09550 [Gammaproteobacteria bacterium]